MLLTCGMKSGDELSMPAKGSSWLAGIMVPLVGRILDTHPKNELRCRRNQDGLVHASYYCFADDLCMYST